MPRRSSFGGSRRMSSPTRSSMFRQAPPRQGPTTQAPPQSRGMGLGGILAQGMAFGAGSEMAHSAIRGMSGGHGYEQQPVVQQSMDQQYDQGQQQQQQQQNYCQYENEKFIQCLKANNDSIKECQPFFEMLKQCEKKLM